MKKIIIAIISIFNIVFAVSLFASPQVEGLTVLYFFSSNCPHCARVTPIIKELSATFPVQGLLYGKGDIGSMPFDVKKGDKAASKQYGVTGVPSLVILQDKAFRMKINGERDIKNAPLILKALQKGALSVSEVVEKGAERSYIVAGWVVSRGEYFKNPRFFLTDRQKTISVKPWLPLEAVKAPLRGKRTRPRLMSDVIDNVVVLEGALTGSGRAGQFIAEREISIE